MDPSMCPHNSEDMSGPRGSGSKEGTIHWVTCLKCGSRWERIWEEFVPKSVRAPARPTTAPNIAEEDFTELFSETDSDRQFALVQPKGRMVAAGIRRPEMSPVAVERWMANQAGLPSSSVVLPLTTSSPATMETPTPAMIACHEAVQTRLRAGMNTVEAIDHVWASCNSDEEVGAMRAYMLANPTLQLSTQ